MFGFFDKGNVLKISNFLHVHVVWTCPVGRKMPKTKRANRSYVRFIIVDRIRFFRDIFQMHWCR